MVELITLVKYDGFIAQHREAVGKAFGDEQLQEILIRQLKTLPLAVGRASCAQIDRHIQDLPLQHTHQLGLGKRFQLVMQAADHAEARLRLVVLHPGEVESLLPHLAVVVTLEKVSPFILKDAGSDDQQSFYAGFFYFHDQ